MTFNQYANVARNPSVHTHDQLVAAAKYWRNKSVKAEQPAIADLAASWGCQCVIALKAGTYKAA